MVKVMNQKEKFKKVIFLIIKSLNIKELLILLI